MTPRRKRKGVVSLLKWGAGIVILLIGGVFLALYLTNQNRVVEGPDGNVLRLEEYHVATNTVTYELPNNLMHQFSSRMPKWVPDSLRLYEPEQQVTVDVNEPGVSKLSAAFMFDSAPRVLRLVVSDSHDRTFDPAGHDANVGEGHWVGETSCFPRRGKRLHLRLMEQDRELAKFTVSNPAYKDYPKWKAPWLPVTKKKGGVEWTLTDFRIHTPETYGEELANGRPAFPRTLCAFEVQQGGEPTTGWRPTEFELRDATGNSLRRSPLDSSTSIDGDRLTSGFIGALWESDSAWKIKVEFRQVSDFREDQILKFNGLELPGPQEMTNPEETREVDDATVRIDKIIGPKVSPDRTNLLNADRAVGALTVLITGDIRSEGYRLEFVEANAANGEQLVLESDFEQPPTPPGRSPDTLPYTVNLEVPDEGESFDLSLAVTSTRTVTFQARPQHAESEERE